MCQLCGDARHVDEPVVPRRGFLKLAAGAAVGFAVAGRAFAEETKRPPKPENVISPDVALERLMAGNKRYVEGVARRHDFKAEREALSMGQNPFAGILSCADSRVAPEYAFDTSRGDLFVVRVAGNFATDDGIASFEYAVQVLGAPLLMVLGHEACGAVSAAIQSIKESTTLPGHLPARVKSISPAVEAVLDKPGDTLGNAIRQNVVRNVETMILSVELEQVDHSYLASYSGLSGDGASPARSAHHLDIEIGGPECAPQPEPKQQVGLRAPGRRDVTEIDDGLPAEPIAEDLRDARLGNGVIAADEEVVAAGHAAGFHHHLMVDCVECLDDLRVGQRALNSLADRIVARKQQRGRHPFGEIQRVGDVDQYLAAQIVGACRGNGGDRTAP